MRKVGGGVYVFFCFFFLFGRVCVCVFFAVRAGACFIFCCLGRSVAPAPTAKKIKHASAQTAKNNRKAQTTRKTRQQQIHTLARE